MNFVVVGTNHKYSPVKLREKLFLSKKRLKDILFLLRERDVLKGAIILSTCNRVEIYASTEDSKIGIREIEDFISQYYEVDGSPSLTINSERSRRIDKQKFSPYLYKYEGKEALKHLFSVACGLDSLILGETQILGQVKFSLSEAEGAGFVDGLLSEVFYYAISFAKRIHAETKISEGKISVGSAAIDFIKERLSSLSGKNILIIGVGKVTELVLKYLKKERPNVVFISNRTFEKAKELAAQIGAKAVRFDELKQFLSKADVVITATASPHFIIKKETLPEKTNHELLIIDLALPRDVEPRVKEIKNVSLFSLEDLDTVIKRNMERKVKEAKNVKEIINREVGRLWSEFTKLEQEPALLL